MAAIVRKMQTNFSGGELSDLIEARPDLAKYFNGARTLENFLVYPEGGVFRTPGTLFVKEVKDSTKKTRLIPFEASISAAYIIELGDLYARFYKNGARLESGGSPVELVTPWTEDDLENIHFRQSIDVLFLCDGAHQQREISRLSDTNWQIALFTAVPPPSYEADELPVASIGPSANTGNITVRSNVDIFLAADVGRQIVAGGGRGTITAIASAKQVSVTVISAFAATITAGPNTLSSTGATVTSTGHGYPVGPVPTNLFVVLTSGAQAGEIRNVVSVGDANTFTVDAAFSVNQAGVTWNKITGFEPNGWGLRLPPQTTLDADRKGPVGSSVALVFGANAARSTWVGKYIKVYGGLIELTAFTSATAMTGKILTELTASTADDPAAAPANAWTLEESSWSDARGWPKTLEFHQGRLFFAATDTQPNTAWGSASDDYHNFGVGSVASAAVEYTIASRRFNPIQWLASLGYLFAGDAENEIALKGQGVDAPLGGKDIPFVRDQSATGAMPVQPVICQDAIIFQQRHKKKVYELSYNVESDNKYIAINKTLFARQIGDALFAQHPAAYEKEPNSIFYYVMENGELACLTYNKAEEVMAWSRIKSTYGAFESVAVITHPNLTGYQTWVVVRYPSSTGFKRYIEIFESNSAALAGRSWTSLQTHCAKVGTVAAGATGIGGLAHLGIPLINNTVDIVIGDTYVGQGNVILGAVDIPTGFSPATDTTYEIGFHYDSTLKTMRVALPQESTEALKRQWVQVWARVKNTIGGLFNGERFRPTNPRLYSGLQQGYPTNADHDGYITIKQDQAYPMEVLSIAGTVQFGDQQG